MVFKGRGIELLDTGLRRGSRYLTVLVLLLQVLSLLSASAMAQTLVITPDMDAYTADTYLYEYEDVDANLTIAQISSQPELFRPVLTRQVSKGYTRAAWWFRLELANNRPEDLNWLITSNYSSLDEFSVYEVSEAGGVAVLYEGGDHLPFAHRPIAKSMYVVPFSIGGGESKVYYFRAASSGSLIMPIELLSKEAFIETQDAERLMMGWFWGGLFFLALYNLILFVGVRDVAYLYYVGYILSFILLSVHITGVGFQWLWPTAMWWQTGGLTVICLAAAFNSTQFARKLLMLDQNMPRLDRLLQVYAWVSLPLAASFPFLDFTLTLNVTIAFCLPLACFLLFAGWRTFVDGYGPARYYVSAWVFVFIAVMIFAVESSGLVQGSYVSKWALQVGVGIETLLFAVALSSRINLSKQHAIETQQKIIEQQQAMRDMQDKANLELEGKVDQRTREIARVVADLARANEQLDRLSQIDELTRIPNRRYFNRNSLKLLNQAIERETSLSVLLIDIDHFKQINDRYGHLAGDECLRVVAENINALVTRPDDMVARFGGEEFIVLLSDTDTNGAQRVAEKIRRHLLSLSVPWESMVIHLTASVGVYSERPGSGARVETYTENADKALYQAKAAGRNRVVVWTAEKQPASGNS